MYGGLNHSITSALNIVAYEAELKSFTKTSVVLALTVKSFSSDATNLAKTGDQNISL